MTHKFSSDWLKEIHQQKLFKMYLPADLDGPMLTMPDALRTIEEAAYIDGNFGWAIMIGAGGNYFAPFMSPDASKNIFAPKESVIAGSGTPSGEARQVPGGYIVSGAWKYCSGSTYATIFTANCVVVDAASTIDMDDSHDSQAGPRRKLSEAAKEIRSVAFTPQQVHITEDWTSFGLRATEGHSFTVDNAFVPDEMTFDLSDEKCVDNLNFNYPFLQFAQLTTVAVVLGIARHYFEEVECLFADNRARWEATNPTRCAFVMDKMSQSKESFARDRERYRQIVEESWAVLKAGESLPNELCGQITGRCQETAESSMKTAADLFPYTGIDSLMETSSLNRCWRDLQAAAHHSLLVYFPA